MEIIFENSVFSKFVIWMFTFSKVGTGFGNIYIFLN